MRSWWNWTVAATLAGTAAVTACTGPTDSREDLDRVANETLTLAEATLPGIAENLDAHIVEVHTFADREGGAEGSTPYVTFRVHGTISGPRPTQAELAAALEQAGFVVQAEDNPSDSDPRSHAVSADGATEIALDYWTPGGGTPGILFTLYNVTPLRVSNATVDDFRRDFQRQFDASLVDTSAPRSALEEHAMTFLDGTESALPSLAEGLGVRLSSAEFVTTDDESDPATASVVFTVDAVLNGPTPSQETLEQALIDAGYPDIVSRNDTNPPDFPYARAVSIDGTTTLDVWFSTQVGEEGEAELHVRSPSGLSVSDAELADFKGTFTRAFDQSLLGL